MTTNESLQNATGGNAAATYVQVTPAVIWTGPVTAGDRSIPIYPAGFPPQTTQGTPVAPMTRDDVRHAAGMKTTTCPCCDCAEEDCTCSDQCATCTCEGRPGYYAPLKKVDPEADEERTVVAPGAKSQREPATIDFGFKADPTEVEIGGEVGLLCQGFASKYNEQDAVGEEQLPGAFRSFGEEWFAQKEPLVLYNHGMDGALGARPIGRGLNYKMEPDGVYVEVFVPRQQAEGWQDKRAKKRFADIYSGIKTGVIRGFSVGGAFTRFGKKLANWATVELSITPAPCLASATFALGRKAVIDRYGAVPMGLGEDLPQEQNVLGQLTRNRWSSVMGLAKQDGDHGLHDYLLTQYAPALQGKHDSDDCSLCADRRAMMGVKASQNRGDYLVAEGDSPSDWHLPVKENGKPSHRLMAAARAALTSNFRGRSYQGPKKAEALKKLKALYKSEGMEWDDSGSGGKGTFEAQDVLKEAAVLIAEYNQGVKAGRRHSKETRAAVKFVVDHLNSVFGLEDGKDDSDTDGD